MIVSVSPKPRVVSTAVRAPLNANTALLDWVVAWTMRSVLPSSTGTLVDRFAAASASPLRTPCCRSPGVVSALPMAVSPLRLSIAITSVKVPPISTAIVYTSSGLRAGIQFFTFFSETLKTTPVNNARFVASLREADPPPSQGDAAQPGGDHDKNS